ncbi:HupE/UreJ family protein [Undibacterium sp. WLX3042]|uniref:HupE/UreJ family protein n=1 Tax=Undibacterium sp. WLX3042 TaxID=3412686 RepID=UPI003C30BCA2
MKSITVKSRHLLSLLSLLSATMLVATPAFAHVSVMHSVAGGSGFLAGFLHPLMGTDHLLAMLAVGIWAAQHQRPAYWLLPLAFPLMMTAGAALGMSGVILPGVEAGIAASVLILGLLIAGAVKLPLAASTALIAVFAVAHGYAHGVEMPVDGKALAFGAGFVAATALLHLSGLFATITTNHLLSTKISAKLNRIAGAGIALSGLFFVSAMA